MLNEIKDKKSWYALKIDMQISLTVSSVCMCMWNEYDTNKLIGSIYYSDPKIEECVYVLRRGKAFKTMYSHDLVHENTYK